MLPSKSLHQALDVGSQLKILNRLQTPVWVYDAVTFKNVWGNRACLKFFTCTESQFLAPQKPILESLPTEKQTAWLATNQTLMQFVQDASDEMELSFNSQEATPGFLPFTRTPFILKAKLSKQELVVDGQDKVMIVIEVVDHGYFGIDDNQLRMVDMCNSHPMFQFLFDENGTLLSANKQGLVNLRQHLGSSTNFTLHAYLATGEYDGSATADQVYTQAMDAIFKLNKPCHRFPQLRWSKRHPGKFRWVLYEMWPMTDPVTGAAATLVCEQNITQVKQLEEQFKKQNERLEAQLEEALAKRAPMHQPAIDIDTPADKTLKLLDKIMRAEEISPREAMELREAILHTGDLLQPVNFNEQLMKKSNSILDNEVSQSLIQLLSTRKAKEAGVHREVHQPHLTSTTMEAVRTLIQIQKNLPDEVMAVLATADNWQFDAFQLNEVSKGRPLSMLAFALLQRYDVVNKFQLDQKKLATFLMRVEDGYPNNPYHNRIHAADVVQSVHVLLIRGGLLLSSICDDVALLSCYLAAIIHDYEHKGVNNDYLIRVSDSLAVLYNDRSPMENHHLAAAFQLMNTDEFNFMRKVPAKTKEGLRKQIIDMVLATDMKQHFAIHSMFQAKMQLSSRNSGTQSMRTNSPSTSADTAKTFDDDQKILILQVALKCADVGHLASPRTVHRLWVSELEEEFFRQGDREKQNGLPVSPLMDREKNGITKSQVGFFDIVALPLFQSFSQAFPDATPMLDAVKDNYTMWKEEAAACASSKSGPINTSK